MDDLANAKLILTILPAYIPPLSGAVNRDSVPRDFEYTLVTMYLPKGIHAVQADKDKIAALKFITLDHRQLNVFLPPHTFY
jgi:hypothetical protein